MVVFFKQLFSLLFLVVSFGHCQEEGGIVLTDRELLLMANSSLMDFSPTDFLLKHCLIDSSVNAPQEFAGIPTNMTIEFSFDRILNIDDVTESVKANGALTVDMTIPCLRAAYLQPEWPKSLTILTSEDTTSYWSPSIFHRNSLDIDESGTSRPSKLVLILPLALLRRVYVGYYESYCDLDLFKFPFDK